MQHIMFSIQKIMAFLKIGNAYGFSHNMEDYQKISILFHHR